MLKIYTKKNAILLLALVAMGCGQPSKKAETIDPLSTGPASEIKFLKLVDSLRDDNLSTDGNAIKTDKKIQDFNKYAVDSLKEVKDWIVVVNEVNDSPMGASSTGALLFNVDSVYNLRMYATIRNFTEKEFDKSLDSLNHPQADVVFLTYTVPKAPTDEKLKKHLDIIKKLSMGDTLLISGAVTRLNKDLKPDFSELIKSYGEWEVDFLATDIKKK